MPHRGGVEAASLARDTHRTHCHPLGPGGSPVMSWRRYDAQPRGVVKKGRFHVKSMDRSTALSGATVTMTGGFGLVGSRIVHKLRAVGAKPSAVGRLDAYGSSVYPSVFNISPGSSDVIAGDITDAALIDDLLARSDYVIHAAVLADVAACTRNPAAALQADIHGTQTVLDAAARHTSTVKRLVFVSSASVYGIGGFLERGGRPVQRSRSRDAQVGVRQHQAVGASTRPHWPWAVPMARTQLCGTSPSTEKYRRWSRRTATAGWRPGSPCAPRSGCRCTSTVADVRSGTSCTSTTWPMRPSWWPSPRAPMGRHSTSAPAAPHRSGRPPTWCAATIPTRKSSRPARCLRRHHPHASGCWAGSRRWISRTASAAT